MEILIKLSSHVNSTCKSETSVLSGPQHEIEIHNFAFLKTNQIYADSDLYIIDIFKILLDFIS